MKVADIVLSHLLASRSISDAVAVFGVTGGCYPNIFNQELIRQWTPPKLCSTMDMLLYLDRFMETAYKNRQNLFDDGSCVTKSITPILARLTVSTHVISLVKYFKRQNYIGFDRKTVQVSHDSKHIIVNFVFIGNLDNYLRYYNLSEYKQLRLKQTIGQALSELDCPISRWYCCTIINGSKVFVTRCGDRLLFRTIIPVKKELFKQSLRQWKTVKMTNYVH